jgi:hypothetical protein
MCPYQNLFLISLTNTTSDEGEHERRISGDLRRDLEFCGGRERAANEQDATEGFVPRSAVAVEEYISYCNIEGVQKVLPYRFRR